MEKPAAWGNAISLVVEALRVHLCKVPDGGRAQQLGVNRGNSVGAVRPGNRKVGHPHVLGGSFLHQAHAGSAPVIAGEANSNLVEKAPVDLVNDLQMAGG